MAFHGTADRDVQFDGSFGKNVAPLIPFAVGPSRAEIVAAWAVANGCGVPASETEIPPDIDLDVYECAPDASVEMYVVDEGGHTWPGSTPGPYTQALGGNTTKTVDATHLIWTFFEQHALSG